MKALKYSLIGLVALIALAAGAAAIFALSFDPNRYKGEIERLAKERTGRTLKLQGPLQIAFFPSLGARVAGVSLSEHGSEREFLSLESAHGAVAVMPLLHGQVVVDRISVAGLKANVVKGKDGRYNFSDLLEAQAGKPKSEGPVKFDIAGVSVERSSVAYRDLATGSDLALSDVKLSTGRIAEKADGRLEFQGTVKGKNPAVDAKVDVSGHYKVDFASKAYELSKLDARVTGAAGGMTDLKLSAKGDVAADPSRNEYRVKGLALDVTGAKDRQRLEAKVAVPEVLVSKDQAKGGAITAEFKLKGDGHSTEAALRLSGVQGSAKALVIPAITGEVAVSGPDLPNKGFKVPLSGSARADLDKHTASAELASKFDESSIQAKLGLAKFSPPSYVFDVNVDRLNVDKYFPPKPKAAGTPEPDSAVDFSALKDLNASGRLQFGALQVKGLKLANVKAEIKAANGRLDVSPHSASLYDGALSGALSLQANGNRVALKEALSNVSVGPLLRDVVQRDALEGRGNLSLDVSGSGATVNAIKKALNGNARLNLRDGAIKGINVGELLQKARSLGQKSTESTDKSKKTDFSELNASFVIKNGVAHNEDLDLKAPFFRIGGAGDIDIGNSSLNYVTKAAVVATAKGQGGADLSQLAGLTVPIKLIGPFDAVKYEVDYAAVAADLVKSKVGEQVKGKIEQNKGKVEEQVRDRLKGLFGR